MNHILHDWIVCLFARRDAEQQTFVLCLIFSQRPLPGLVERSVYANISIQEILSALLAVHVNLQCELTTYM